MIEEELKRVAQERGTVIANAFMGAILPSDNLVSVNHALNCVMYGFARLAHNKGHSLEEISKALVEGMAQSLIYLEQKLGENNTCK